MSETSKPNDIHNRHVRHKVVTEGGVRFAEIELGGEERDLPLPTREPDLFDSQLGQGSDAARSGAGQSGVGDSPASLVQPEESLDLDWNESFRYISREQQFVQQARELAWHVEEAAPFVPFKSYWPTYDQMTRDQHRWYFYWREEVRSGRYPDTDLSYLFIYVYELIHGIGWSDPAQGYALMNAVWEAYRGRYPKLDTYLREWLYDFMLVHGLDMPVKEIPQRLPRSLSSVLKELEWLRRFSADPVDLGWDYLLDIIDYDVEKSRFYREGGRKALQQLSPKVIALADSYSARYEGGRLIERYRPRPRQVTRYLFRSAVYDHEMYGRTASVTVLMLSEHAPLRSYMTQLVRLTENKLRELKGYKGRLRGIEVPAELEELVGRFLKKELHQEAEDERKKSAPAVKIDSRKLRRLQRESDEVRDMLLTDAAHTDAAVSAAATKQQAEAAAALTDSPEERQGVREAAGKAKPLERETPPAKRGGSEQAPLFQAVMDFDTEPPVRAPLAETSVHPAAAASPNSAEVPASSESSKSSKSSDSRESFATSDSSKLPVPPSLLPERPLHVSEQGEVMWNTASLDEEWQQLAERLAPVHLALLLALKHGPDREAMQRAADQAGSMPELLLDEINDAAMDTIGDLLVDGDAIVDEYRDKFETLMRV
ncbi:TerB N-terminal domain-containing protein [Paenibacillus campinasensis]|uniref:TerB N-terminal domain-containing protein n=1 Tax=Paenibacillus campinasensis TaxID=66347 RepID=A0A268EG53_9BACL|nr:TerB N-terminal domain-containing protein [Paenibacillus campinasensis]PAD72108.1 hypothetical protein CHH67_23130 [Paenibacillus campinasensis]